MTAAVLLMFLSLCRPSLLCAGNGESASELAVALVLDLSGSMEARQWTGQGDAPESVESGELGPSRMELEQKAAAALLEMDGIQASVVVFARSAYLACPASAGAIQPKRRIGLLKTMSFEDGTAIGDGILCALRSLKGEKHSAGAVVLFSDGADHSSSERLELAIKEAKTAGVPVFTVGIGEEQAYHPVNLADGTIQWRKIGEKMDADLLRRIAYGTDAKFYHLTGDGLNESIAGLRGDLESWRKSADVPKETLELTNWLLVSAALLLAISSALRA